MSTIKSYSVGNGDMFYIEHGSDNFTIIDCCLDEDDVILNEIFKLKGKKGISRFISTHPDDDHIGGLQHLDDKIRIVNFYCVKNDATKDNETDDFMRYCELRDSSKAFHIKKGCTRKWMNKDGEGRGSSGINILWPDVKNADYMKALEQAAEGESPNNISPIIKYSLADGVTALWMGDLETEFMESIEHEVSLPKADLLFAPHHGRDSGRVPSTMLEAMDPKIVIIGEAPCDMLNYYEGYDTITQNSAGDIVFDCTTGKVHIFTSNDYEAEFLDDEGQYREDYYYAGTLNL